MTKATQTVHEPLLRIAKRDGIPFGKKVLVRAVAILLALVVDALFIFFVTGLNPLAVYGVMYQGTFATPVRISWAPPWPRPSRCASGTSAARGRCSLAAWPPP